jgi:hypothetical protein
MADHPDVPVRRPDVLVRRVVSEAGRADALAVLAATYREEKQWVSDAESQFPATDIGSDDVAWFVAYGAGRASGVVRILFNPPIAVYARYGLTSLDPANRIEDFIGRPDLAEVGRFAVVPDRRGQYLVAAALMRAVTITCLERKVACLITDVFEDDPHSPFGFHTRVLGFRPVATHDVGELNCKSRRITMVLELAPAYRRLRRRNHWFYRYVNSALSAALSGQVAAA